MKERKRERKKEREKKREREKEQKRKATVLLKGITGKTIQRHGLYSHPTRPTPVANPLRQTVWMTKRDVLDAKSRSSETRQKKRAKGQAYIFAKAHIFVKSEQTFDPNFSTFGGFQARVKAQQFHPSLKHSLTSFISED